MNIHSTVMKSVSPQNLISELHFFIKGAVKVDRVNLLDLTKSALTLLKALPACRTAVFEYFCFVFDKASKNFIESIETEINTGELPKPSETDEAVVTEIHTVLVGLIAEAPTAWAPIISTWSLDLLGEISTKYAGRAHISHNLNEALQLWMSCRATRTLVDINTKCLTSLIHLDTEACISALLDTSVKHSPNFDWVVAHVGSCFPNTVITRVLSVGLKDFCQNKSYEQGVNSPKLRSVVGILGHLAASHVTDIRQAIMDMFTWSLTFKPDDKDYIKNQKKATVPYILQLAFLSSTLLLSLSLDAKHTLSTKVIETLYTYIEDWSKYFGTPEALESLVISLILKCESGGLQIVNLLLDCIHMKGDDVIHSEIRDKACEMLEDILNKTDDAIRRKCSVSLLESFSKETAELHLLLLSPEEIRSQTAARIIVFLGYKNPSVLIRALTFLLQNAESSQHLALLLKMLNCELIDKTSSPYVERGGHFSVALGEILSRNYNLFSQVQDEHSNLAQMWGNLYKLLRWEQTGDMPLLKSRFISRAIQVNLESVTMIFSRDIAHMHIISDVLDAIEVASDDVSFVPSVQTVLNLTQAAVNYFFVCCQEQGTYLMISGFKKVNKILKRVCNFSKSARILALRELLERSLFQSEKVLFGAKDDKTLDGSHEKFLLKQNRNISKTIPLTKHSSVFNGGVIGHGKRKGGDPAGLPDSVVAENTGRLVETLRACCCALPSDREGGGGDDSPGVASSGTGGGSRFMELSLDAVTLLSLQLVQMVSPDVMYNGLPWPEEEFSKVTIERDLLIRRLFTYRPLLWELLTLVAVHRPALCYCSVLLRALTAVLVHQWRSTGTPGAFSTGDAGATTDSLRETTARLLDLMALGQLLPPPLSKLGLLVPHLDSVEIVSILRECVWPYMRDHVPSPALFSADTNGVHWRDPAASRAPEPYTATVRIIMQRNIRTLGHLYRQMFIATPSDDEA